MSHTVVITSGFPENGKMIKGWAAENNIQIADASDCVTEQEFIDFIQKHNPIAIASSGFPSYTARWSDNLVNSLPPSLKAICNFSAGYDGMGDLERYKVKGIQISNTPNGVAQSTADTGVYLILGAMRNFGRYAINLRAGHWRDGIPFGIEYDGKILGILGFGGVGSLVRDKIRGAFHFEKIQYHNRRRAAPEREQDSVYVSMDELLSTSDVILTVLPLNKDTHHLINRETIAKMKKGAILVNIGRGPVVEEAAVVEALESGHLANVGFDVYENEPKISEGLLNNKNALLLPHVGTNTTLARNKMMRDTIGNVESVIKTGNVITLIPELRTR